MSGRGRRGGRGRGSGLSFSVESIGFGRGDSLPPPIAQPPALYPSLEFKPTPLITGEEQDYLLNLKQELRGTLCDSGYYIKPVSLKKDVDRYSDKYQQGSNNDINWDWSRFPKELKPTRGRKRLLATKPTVSKKNRKNISEHDITNKLEQLESAEKIATSDDEQEDEEKNNDEVERDDEEHYDEEEQEEGTDYIADYFDNGEDYLDEDDNLDDGPTY